ncbi:MAG: O-antigen ligase family protein [Chloroflexota bacterium]
MIESYSALPETGQKPVKFWSWIFPLVLLAVLLGMGVALTVNAVGVLALIAIVGLLLVLGTLTNPDLGLMMFILVIYINLSSVLITNYGLPSIAKPLVVLMGLLIVIRGALFRDEYHGWILPAILLGLYSFIGSATLIYASDFSLALATLTDYLKDAVIAIIIIMLIQRPSSLRRAVWALLLTGLFMGTLSVFQQLTGTFGNDYFGFARVNSSSTTGTRLAGPIGDPNFYAQIMVLLIPLTIDRVWNERKLFLKALAGWAFFVITLTVIFTYSRGAFLALVAALVFMAIKRPPRLPTALLGLAAALLIFQFVPVNYRDRITTLFDFLPWSQSNGFVDQSIQGRTSENIVAWNMFLDNPILGVGLGNYNAYYEEYSRKLGIDPRREGRSAHNLYLEIAAERGILGLLLFGSIVALTLAQTFKAEKLFKELGNKSQADLSALLGISILTYLITAIFLHDAFPRFFWVIVGLAWSAPQCAQYSLKIARSKPAKT